MSRSTRSTGRGAYRRSRAVDAGAQPPRTLNELMTEALVMEIEAAQRYLEFAGLMEARANIPVAVLFRKMAATEGRHAEQIMHEMGWANAPAAPGKRIWEGFAVPLPPQDESALVQPWHALTLALAAEQRAERFFADLAEQATVDAVRNAARELQREEEAHCDLIRAWLARLGPPQPDAAPAAGPQHAA